MPADRHESLEVVNRRVCDVVIRIYGSAASELVIRIRAIIRSYVITLSPYFPPSALKVIVGNKAQPALLIGCVHKYIVVL